MSPCSLCLSLTVRSRFCPVSLLKRASRCIRSTAGWPRSSTRSNMRSLCQKTTSKLTRRRPTTSVTFGRCVNVVVSFLHKLWPQWKLRKQNTNTRPHTHTHTPTYGLSEAGGPPVFMASDGMSLEQSDTLSLTYFQLFQLH